MKRAPQLPSTTALGISSPGGLAMPPILEQDERSEEKASGEEEPLVPAMESNAAAVGGAPGQPGKSMVNLSLSDALQDVLGVVAAGTVRPAVPLIQSGGDTLGQQGAGHRPASAGSGTQLTDLLEGLRALLGRFEAVVGGTGGSGVEMPPAAPIPVQSGVGVVTEKAGEKGDTEKAERTNMVRTANAAKCEVYLYFEGLLGAHLKQEVRDKIYKGEYVEIFRYCHWKKLTWTG